MQSAKPATSPHQSVPHSVWSGATTSQGCALSHQHDCVSSAVPVLGRTFPPSALRFPIKHTHTPPSPLFHPSTRHPHTPTRHRHSARTECRRLVLRSAMRSLRTHCSGRPFLLPHRSFFFFTRQLPPPPPPPPLGRGGPFLTRGVHRPDSFFKDHRCNIQLPMNPGGHINARREVHLMKWWKDDALLPS